MRAWVMGTCVGVAVAFPAIVVAQILIAGFGALRRGVAGDEVEAWTVPALTVIGGLLGSIGALASQAGRTRR